MTRLTPICLLTASLLIVFVGCQPEAAYQEPPPPKVTVVTPLVKDVPIFHEENGQTEAVEQAMVKSRVSGILEEIKFDPDDEVTEGDDLFAIEKKQYIAAVESAKADVSSAEAELESAKADIEVKDAEIAAVAANIAAAEAEFKRIDQLKNSNAVSTLEWDTAKAALGTAQAAEKGAAANKSSAMAKVTNVEAKVEKAKADLRQAELDLEWTDVKAPISGRVDRLLVKRGNLVENGTELIQIIKNNPIWANFNLSEGFILEMERRASRDRDGRPDPTTIKVFLSRGRGGSSGFPFVGHLDYYDPKIDQDTATMQLRGIFSNNQDGKWLTPGMFVRVRIQIGTYENAVLVPERAIGRDTTGTYVFIVDQENKAQRKNVELGTKQGELIVIASGLKATDTVIVDGIQRVRAGAVVAPETIPITDPLESTEGSSQSGNQPGGQSDEELDGNKAAKSDAENDETG